MGSRVAGRIAFGAGLRLLGTVGSVGLLGLLIQPARPCLAATAVTAPPRGPAVRPPVAVGAAVTVDGGVTRLVVDLSAPTTVAAAVTEEPDRVVLDLPEVDFEVDPAAARIDPRGVGLVRAFRFGLFAPGRSRIVLDLAGPAVVRRAEVRSIAGGDASRLVVELAPCDRAAFHEAARRPAPAAAPAVAAASLNPTAPAAPRPGAPRRPVVVIDPGHGGIDPGASGPFGGGGSVGGSAPKITVEKDVVLLFSTALAARLSAGDRYRVVMTRRDDSFVSLDDRVRIAREAVRDGTGAGESDGAGDAALMISVHADSLSDGSVSGATVYTAADRASDAEAARVAASENRSDAAAGLDDAPGAAADVSDILFDLTRRETRAYAHRFQRTLTGYWARVARLNHNPERSAGFKVLQAPDVPSVLLELGYLSSGQDARAFGSAEWRGRAVDGVAASIDAFFGGQDARGSAGPDADGSADHRPRGTAAAR